MKSLMHLGICFALIAVAAVFVLANEPKKKTEIKEEGDCKLDWVCTQYAKGPFLFTVSHRPATINIFSRDEKTGDIKFKSFIPIGPTVKKELNLKPSSSDGHLDAYLVMTDKNILYATGDWSHSKGDQHSIGLSWYQIDPAAGTGKFMGAINCDAGRLYQSPADPNTLYLAGKFSGAVEVIKLAADGKPTVAEKIKEKGTGYALAFSPDKKFAYSLNPDGASWLAMGQDGSLKYIGSTPLEGASSGKISYNGIAVSPDGKNVYASFCWNGAKEGGLWIYNTDAATGKLSLVEKAEAKEFRGINELYFSADGKTVYTCGGPECPAGGLCMATRDPATGKLAFGKKIYDRGAWSMAYTPENGTIYFGGYFSSKSFMIFTISK